MGDTENNQSEGASQDQSSVQDAAAEPSGEKARSAGERDREATDKQPADLVEAVKEAKQLVRFVVRAGRPVPDEVIQSIVESADAFASGEWNASSEARFWNAYRRISEAVTPVSINSIRATMSMAGERPKAIKQTRWFAALTMLSLVLLLFCQIYWVIGANITNHLNELVQERTKLAAETMATQFRLDGISRELSTRMTAPPDLQEVKESGGEAATPAAGEGEITVAAQFLAQVPVEQLFAEQNRVLVENRRSTEALEANAEALQANFILLDDWSGVWRTLFGADPGTVSWWDSEEEIQAKKQRVEVEKALSSQIALSSAHSTLKSMSSYILPLLYGLLGACAYILRSLAREINEVTFTDSSHIHYWLRLPLGMLSGIAVGWFFTPDNLPSALQTIQPLALAFLAGYSVELLFTGLDRLISAFAGDHRSATAR